MKISMISLAAGLVVAGLPLGALAQNCFANASAADDTLTVSSQADLSPFFPGCTTIDGNIRISNQFIDSSFVLNDIVNVTGKIYMEYGQGSGILSSFVMHDLVSLSALDLRNVSEVQTPTLQTAGEITLVSSSGGTADLSSLVEAERVWFGGPWENVNLQSLKNITSLLMICSSIDCELGIDDRHETDSDAAISIDLPVLEFAQYVIINTTFVKSGPPSISLSMRVPFEGRSDAPAASGFELFYPGRPTEFSMKPLQILYGRLTIVGDLAWVDISPITNINASVFVNTTTRSKVTSTLQEVPGSLDIHGKVAYIDFPYLVSVDKLDITSEYEDTIPCPSSLQEFFNKTETPPSDRPPWCDGSSNEDEDEDEYDDDGETDTDEHRPGWSSTRRPLGAGAIAGIVVGIVVFVALLVGCCIRVMRRSGKGRSRNDDGTQLLDVNANVNVAGIGATNTHGGGHDGSSAAIDDEYGGVAPPSYSKDPPVT
ncbi:hypothetical protein BDW74DRAFT_175036 [Aspergillus multicolor]|uniref:uncharacterized protein n=1 Tax=Aspergillus multicolor TaxID=41759 RepID=UPI003CCCF7C2